MKPEEAEAEPLLTAGVDLSTDPAKTAACVIEWRRRSAVIRTLKLDVSDEEIRSIAANCAKLGIDAPFGWPREFVRAVHAYATQPVWPSATPSWLSRRETDRQVLSLTKLNPLAVAADRIGSTAMRCAGILAGIGVSDRSGEGRACEVYPAAALKRWRLAHQGYKLKDAEQGPKNVLAANVSSLRLALPALGVGEDQEALLRSSDDAFDAMVAAIVAKAVVDKRAVAPKGDVQLGLAREEGWIWLPGEDYLARLAESHLESR
jgi:predicted nuclease with RNAse H fold